MKRTSKWFYFPCFLILFIVLLAAFGSLVKPHGLTEADRIRLVIERVDGVLTYEGAPLTPRSEFWLGTDHRGFDLLSLLLNGLKYTLLYAALLTALRFL